MLLIVTRMILFPYVPSANIIVAGLLSFYLLF